MNGLKHIYLFIMLLVTLLAISCADDDRQAADAIPDGYGKLTITISTPEAAQTRAVNTSEPWLQGTTDERAIKSYHLLVCNGNTIMQAISGDAMTLGDHDNANNYFPSTGTITTDILPIGTYDFTFYCLANFTSDMLEATGLTISNGKVTNTELPANFETKVMQPIANGISAVPSTGLPMTGKLTQSSVNITKGNITTIVDPLILWRMMAKLEFLFTNETSSEVRVKGIEVEPINQTTASGSGVYLISQDNLFSVNNQMAQYVSEPVNKTDVTATWPLNTTNLQTKATNSENGLFATTQLTYGSKLQITELTTVNSTHLQKFMAIQKLDNQEEEEAAIIFRIKPKNGLTFKPKNLSFKVCRVGTDTGILDVVEVIDGTTNNKASGIVPQRNNADPYLSECSYELSGVATEGEYIVKIYIRGLNANKELAFSNVIITGDVTNTTNPGEGITLPSAALTDVGTVSNTPSTALELSATNGTGTLFFYVNETDATYTTTENQLSVRIKLARWNSTTNAWYDDEIRFGLTTPYTDGKDGGNGFNVIRRNDWIHIPIHLRDWQFRVEPVAFVPIAGYPATMLSSDALTTTFSTGGYIILQPFAQKNNDGAWRDFSDPEVTFVSMTATGDTQMFETAPAYDSTTQRITGILRNNLSSGTYKTTLTVNVKLGPSGSQQNYSFTCNVVLQK